MIITRLRKRWVIITARVTPIMDTTPLSVSAMMAESAENPEVFNSSVP